MSFGHVMQLQVGELTIELAPIRKNEVHRFIETGGMQYRSISKYLNARLAPTQEDEEEWYDKTRADKASTIWGIYVVDGAHRLLIGSTGLHDIGGEIIRQATSGILIVDKTYWNRGIARASHVARTMYAFEQLGLHRIKSAVIIGNHASRKALHAIGYSDVYVERNTAFVDGSLKHQHCLELLNPNEPFWSVWWGTDAPSAASLEARDKTLAAVAAMRSSIELL